ncbi:MAG: hypothetical protein IKG42_01745 [Clostridia bacterium]|nr:hypothetical protein [Clostridia bacterium]
MAVNPMQRKSRLSFVMGILVAVLVAGLVIMLLFVKIKKLQDEKQELIDSQPVMTTVYTVSERISKDGEISELTPLQMDITKVPDNILTSSDFDYEDEDGEYKQKTFKALVDIEPHTVVTKSMVEENSDKSDSLRLVEYNMFTLPSTLEAGQYIDLRIAFSTGADFVVASKKYVEDANASTIWLKLGEKDMMTINCAIIESYIIEGTKIYATLYTDSTQAKATVTYTPNDTVVSVIKANSNIDVSSPIGMRAFVESLLDGKTSDERASLVQSGFNSEASSLKATRDELMGTY